MKKRILIPVVCLCLGCLFACGQEPAQPTVGVTELSAPTATPLSTPEPALAPVEICGQTVSAYTEELTIPGEIETPDEIRDALFRLPNLRTVTVDRAVPETNVAGWAAAWAALEAKFPAVTFTGRTLYHGAAAETVEVFAPQAVPDGTELEAIGNTFEKLAVLDLGALTPDREAVAALTALAPAVNVQWKDETFGPSESAWETVTLSAPGDPDAVKTYLTCFPRLREADILAAGLNEAEGDALAEAFPAVAFRRMVTLNGVQLDSFTEELDLSNARIADYDGFCEAVGRFPRLRRLEMSFCSLTNEQLAALRSRYPQAGVAWTVKVHGRLIRTDAVAYSSKQYKDNTDRFTSKDCQNFVYCNKLIALDLGHNAITDISWLETLEDLQLLILADNKIRDLTPLTHLKKLKYVEIFVNPLTDISPLGELPELLDVNLCFCYTGRITDVSPLSRCKKLERIWLTGNKYISQEAIAELQAALPDAHISYTRSSGSTGDGWRDHPRYDAYIEMFRKNIPVAPFVPEE